MTKAKLLRIAKKQAQKIRVIVNREYVAIAYYWNKKGGEK